METHFDYIIAGAGLSGLSLAWHLMQSPLSGKKILLVDENLTPQNDKIWSFWYDGRPPFEPCIHKSWQQICVVFDDQKIQQRLKQYTYHSIRSGAFKEFVYEELHRHNNVTMLEAPIDSLQFNGQPTLQTTQKSFTAEYIFQSCFTPPALRNDTSHYPLIQHFLGREIKTQQPVFDAETVTLMDFDTSFMQGMAFVYILPWSPKSAMVEYTVFSDSVKEKAFYREKIELYLHNKFNLQRVDYTIERSEFGRIPMRDQLYTPWYDENILNMGTVGGLTKPTTGYTFSRIQRHAQKIVADLNRGNPPALPPRSPRRYRAYDLWLLQIMHDHPRKAVHIFRQLFSHNRMDEIFRFLSEANTISQDLKTMSKVSYPPFFRAMWETRKRLMEMM